MEFKELYEKAYAVVNPRSLTELAEAGAVGAALLTAAGNIYTGVNLDMACSVGFCAEHAAAAAMITAGENQVVKFIAVGSKGNIMPPCGRCREFLTQLHPDNRDAEVMVNEKTVMKLKDLLPYYWHEA